ncbi:sulfite exporter TauE/SafE family protein [Leptospira sp. 2 VSF19]|uniref:Probable membrane transporter protein n=1 Tax=Leptospira soteropolitanensis TaxID=2950025 RepID=A0AAW5VLC2_9LEPT|nr:sulfite exporter TauE/SafE family protein [Leptospira soteropolitanensis]MCW7491815.1 sulfite exporter TauE/SafE family protein [Leptospira soteropolitanensis]MCW7499399.1 sulfite exporter TauE/SafE family protein [Leptospira soteropolitanensis]MCW7521010.1 sulfite exporter TauE/SafE family protein [Leptospira soteropolitanensis]MCW7525503.1 sulfite exporter TauE/SafE family protein [Leptospira soteropolitanensis]MCW7529369.1 sulfite exporter TauE/SafE family protein [Leptospira soteropolit
MDLNFQIYNDFVWGFWPGIIVVFGVGFFVGYLASFLGLGGGFIYTPFFHSFFHLTAVQAVAVSLAQMPVSSLSGLFVYYKNNKIRWKQGLLLLCTSIPSAQFTAYKFGRFEDTELGKQLYYGIPLSEFIYLIVFTVFLGILAVYNLIVALRRRRKYFQSLEVQSQILNPSPSFDSLSSSSKSIEPIQSKTNENQEESFTYSSKSVAIVLLTGIFFGLFSSLFGIGGGFLAVPLFVYYFRMSPVEAVATSFLGIFLTSFGTSVLFFMQGKLHLELAIIGSFGGIFGARIGSLKAVNAKPYSILLVTAIFQFLVVVWYVLGKLPKF